MNLFKKVSSLTLLVVGLFFSGINDGFSGEELPPVGCTIKVLGIDTPCTKIWCPSTMSMSACGAGDVQSQKCSVSTICS